MAIFRQPTMSELRQAASGRGGAQGRADVRLLEESFEVLHDAGVGVDLGDTGMDFDIGGPVNGQVVPQGVIQATPVAHTPPSAAAAAVIAAAGPVTTGNGGGVVEVKTMDAGDDIRDFEDDPQDGSAGTPGLAAVSANPLVGIALRLLRALMGTATRVTAQHWSRLPGWAQSLLAGLGMGVGFDLALDLPGIPGESGILGMGGAGGADLAHMPQHLVDGHLGAHIIGSWVANGVTFYRLSDGKLAVQNKLGRWKVWRPKKPIVIMPGGANNLRTLLRADAVLNRQSKKIAAMLNRRAGGRRPRTPHPDPKPVVVVTDGHH